VAAAGCDYRDLGAGLGRDLRTGRQSDEVDLGLLVMYVIGGPGVLRLPIANDFTPDPRFVLVWPRPDRMGFGSLATVFSKLDAADLGTKEELGSISGIMAWAFGYIGGLIRNG